MKIFRTALVPSLTAMFALASCQNDMPTTPEDQTINDYTVNWIKKFGPIDPTHDWSMATNITADINPAAFGSGYVVYVYNYDPEKGGVLIAQVSSPMTLDLNVAKDAKTVYVRAYNPDCTEYMSSEYSIINGKVDITVKSRVEMPLSRADYDPQPGDVEPTNWQWILACEDLGSTDDYDFNDIVIGINYVAGTKILTVTPLAAGGKLKAYVYYNNEKLFEIHQPLNGQDPETTKTGSYSMVNTTTWKGPGNSKFIHDVDFDINEIKIKDGEYVNNFQGFKIGVVREEKGTEKEAFLVQNYRSSFAPQIICVKGDWEWPMERKSIEHTYPGFKGWNQDKSKTDWAQHMVYYRIVKRDVHTAPDHDYVDLQVGSVVWATCNIGATSPEDKGSTFRWGETEPNAEVEYNMNSYSLSSLYTSNITNHTTADIPTLMPAYDAATKIWGNGWRMPTHKEIKSLINNCTFEEIYNGEVLTGYKVTSTYNGESIFLPIKNPDGPTYGHYWSSVPCGDSEYNSYYGYKSYALQFQKSKPTVDIINSSRTFNCLIRPVKSYDKLGTTSDSE